MFVDTHAHITMKQYDADRDETVRRARAAGVAAICDVGLDLASNRAVVEYARTRPEVFPIIGFHPHEASDFDADAVLNRKGWGEVRAVKRREVYFLPESRFLRPGPRLLDGLEQMIAIMNRVKR